ncbi:hypothetical protein BC826DRAFT_67068 [Russula brevipes]|nr:hypothetical protein BC826DRAFT_67068 [Russula brevipes]
MHPDIDLLVVFRANSPSIHVSKQRARQEAQQAEDQYSRLLRTLRNAGLYAVGRRGEHQGQLVVLVSCSRQQLHQLLLRERHSDVLHDLSTGGASDVDPSAIKPAERLRLVHTFVTATPSDGGLGIHPDNDTWSRVESIMALHDPEYNDVWIRSLTKIINVGHAQLDSIRGQVRLFTPQHLAFPHPVSLARPLLSTLHFSLRTLMLSSSSPSSALSLATLDMPILSSTPRFSSSVGLSRLRSRRKSSPEFHPRPSLVETRIENSR